MKEYSTFIYFVGTKLNDLKTKYLNTKKMEPVEKSIAEQGNEFKLYGHSKRITDLIIKKIKTLIPKDKHLLVFVSDHFQPQNNDLKEVGESNNIPVISEVANNVRAAEINGVVVRSCDGYHWNETGHRIVANSIWKDLKKLLLDE